MDFYEKPGWLLLSGFFLLPVHQIKRQRDQRGQRGRTVIDHGIFEFGVVAYRPVGEDFPDLRQNQGKQHHAEMFNRPEPQREDAVHIRRRMYYVLVGRFHKKVKDEAQYQPEVQQNDKAVFQIDTGFAIVLLTDEISPRYPVNQHDGNDHKQNTGPNVYLKNGLVHTPVFGKNKH